MRNLRLVTRLVLGRHRILLGQNVCKRAAYQRYLTPERCLVTATSNVTNGNPNKDDKSSRSNLYYYVAAATIASGLALALGATRDTLAFSLVSGKITKKTDDDNLNVIETKIATNKDGNNEESGGCKIYTRKDVAEHNSLDKGVWITYKGNVYDITEFIRHHPGGSHTILMGAGGDVEPFWQTYTVHHASEVQRLLSQYKIGELTPEDRLETQQLVVDENNPYASDPKRNPLLQVHSMQPFNAETPPKLLTPTYITPTDIFFVRNHLPVPEVDLSDYALEICRGTDGDPDNLQVLAKFTLDDLKSKFKPHTVDSVIQCSGNRRSDLKKLKEIKGLDWKVGAMGNARWTGVRLVDLLEYLGLSAASLINKEGIRHLQLEGLDCDMTGQSYAASISADYAFDPNKEVLLAYEMNGQPLTRDHGFPLRFVAPGVTGARNVKWLGKIVLSHEESHGHWQRKDYKSFSPNVDMFNLDFNKAVSIQETPVQSAICEPTDGQVVVLSPATRNDDDGKDPQQASASQFLLPVKGYAYSGGGKMIVRVDVSIDGGQTWMTANLTDVPTTSDGVPDYTRRNQVFSWTRWSLDIPIPDELILKSKEQKEEGARPIEVLCRAFDSSYNSQPERAETVWNVRGVVNNSWHRVKLDIKIK